MSGDGRAMTFGQVADEYDRWRPDESDSATMPLRYVATCVRWTPRSGGWASRACLPGRHTASVGICNYLVEGVSCSGKTSVGSELQHRGYHVVHGDRELAYQGDPETGEPIDGAVHEHHVWDVTRVRELVSDQSEAVTFFCGGSRNFPTFIDLFDEVFVLDVDLDTLNRRLDQRPADEWGARPSERELVLRLHRTKEDVPARGVLVDATAPLEDVIDEILRHVDR